MNERRPEDQGIIWAETRPTPQAGPVFDEIVNRVKDRIWAHAVARSKDRGVATTDEADVRYGFERLIQSEIERRTRRPRVWHALITVSGAVGGVVLGRSFVIAPPNQLYWFTAGLVLLGLLLVREFLDAVIPLKK